MRLIVVAVMVAFAAAMAATAFAAEPEYHGGNGGCDELGNCGGGGGMINEDIDWTCDPYREPCSDSVHAAGGGGGHGPNMPGGHGGMGMQGGSTASGDSRDESNPIFEYSEYNTGGGSGWGGGNCTAYYPDDAEPIYGGNGPRCDLWYQPQ